MRVMFLTFWNCVLKLSMIKHRYNDRSEHWKLTLSGDLSGMNILALGHRSFLPSDGLSTCKKKKKKKKKFPGPPPTRFSPKCLLTLLHINVSECQIE